LQIYSDANTWAWAWVHAKFLKNGICIDEIGAFAQMGTFPNFMALAGAKNSWRMAQSQSAFYVKNPKSGRNLPQTFDDKFDKD
jgi:hypothetical protein